MGVKRPDSFDKIVTTYFAGICRKPFQWKRTVYEPKDVVVSPLLFRELGCPSKCGACCYRFSLVYLPDDPRPPGLQSRRIEFQGGTYEVFEDPQDDSESIHCRHLNLEDGRCGIHGVHPFSCDFELIRFTHHLDRVYVGTRFYGRSWNMLRIDGSRGALCTLTPTADVESVVRRLKRLKKWAEYFEIESCVDKIISYAETGPHSKELMIPVRSNSGFLS